MRPLTPRGGMFLKSPVLLCVFLQLSQASKNRGLGSGPSRAHQRHSWQAGVAEGTKSRSFKRRARGNQLSWQPALQTQTVGRQKKKVMNSSRWCFYAPLLKREKFGWEVGGRSNLRRWAFSPPSLILFVDFFFSSATSGSAVSVNSSWNASAACALWKWKRNI